MNSGEAVQLRKLAVSLQGLWAVDWNLLIRDVGRVVSFLSLEGDSTDPESWVSLLPTPHLLSLSVRDIGS